MEKGAFFSTQIGAVLAAIFGFSLEHFSQIVVFLSLVLAAAGFVIQFKRWQLDRHLKIERAKKEGLDVSGFE